MSSVRTIRVSNISLAATEQDIREFFSFSGDIQYIDMQSDNEWSKMAYITFKESQGADTAVLLSGAIIVDLAVSIALAPDYKLPPAAIASAAENKTAADANSSLHKAEDVVTTMLARGFILGKDAMNRAKALDEKHQLSSTAAAKVATFDKKMGLSEKISVGSTVVGDKVREVDQKFQVSEKTKSVVAAAEQKVSSAGSVLMKNRYVFTGAAWVTDAFSRVAKAAEEVGQKAREKVGVAEDEQRKKVVDDFARDQLSDSPKVCVTSEQEPPKATDITKQETTRAPAATEQEPPNSPSMTEREFPKSPAASGQKSPVVLVASDRDTTAPVSGEQNKVPATSEADLPIVTVTSEREPPIVPVTSEQEPAKVGEPPIVPVTGEQEPAKSPAASKQEPSEPASAEGLIL